MSTESIRQLIATAKSQDRGQLRAFLQRRISKPDQENLRRAFDSIIYYLDMVPVIVDMVSGSAAKQGVDPIVAPLVEFVTRRFTDPANRVGQPNYELIGLLDDAYVTMRVLDQLPRTPEPLHTLEMRDYNLFVLSLLGPEHGEKAEHDIEQAFAELVDESLSRIAQASSGLGYAFHRARPQQRAAPMALRRLDRRLFGGWVEQLEPPAKAAQSSNSPTARGAPSNASREAKSPSSGVGSGGAGGRASVAGRSAQSSSDHVDAVQLQQALDGDVDDDRTLDAPVLDASRRKHDPRRHRVFGPDGKFLEMNYAESGDGQMPRKAGGRGMKSLAGDLSPESHGRWKVYGATLMLMWANGKKVEYDYHISDSGLLLRNETTPGERWVSDKPPLVGNETREITVEF